MGSGLIAHFANCSSTDFPANEIFKLVDVLGDLVANYDSHEDRTSGVAPEDFGSEDYIKFTEKQNTRPHQVMRAIAKEFKPCDFGHVRLNRRRFRTKFSHGRVY